MTDSSALRYLYSFFNLEKVPYFEYRRELNIKRMKILASWFDHPEKKYPSILIGGTKGKGSTAVFIQSILQAAGYRVGLYTSPHLLDFRERIRINQNVISKKDLTKLVDQVKRTIEKKRKEIKSLEPVTFFEVSTLIAFLHFAQKKADWVVLEVGMGGRLDATTIVNPNLSVMTPISLDHQEHLGNTIAKIAKDKSMIIRHQTPFVSAKQRPEAKLVLQRRCRHMNVKGVFSGSDFHYRIRTASVSSSIFDFQMGGKKLSKCKINLPGDFQVENASTAIAGFLMLKLVIAKHVETVRNDWEAVIRRGLLSAKWPGRFETIYRKGRIFILDGAHNDASMDALVRNVRHLFRGREIKVIFGASREKDLKPMFKILSSLSSRIIFTKTKQPRAQDIKVMIEAGKPYFHVMVPANNISEALAYSNEIGDKNVATLITGSLFLIAEAREQLT